MVVRNAVVVMVQRLSCPNLSGRIGCFTVVQSVLLENSEGSPSQEGDILEVTISKKFRYTKLDRISSLRRVRPAWRDWNRACQAHGRIDDRGGIYLRRPHTPDHPEDIGRERSYLLQPPVEGASRSACRTSSRWTMFGTLRTTGTWSAAVRQPEPWTKPATSSTFSLIGSHHINYIVIVYKF